MTDLMILIGIEDCIICNGVIGMLRLSVFWRWKKRKFPLFRKGDYAERYIYENTEISLADVRGIHSFYKGHISFSVIDRIRFLAFIVALLNEGVSVGNVLKILREIYKYLETEKANLE